MARIRSIKPEYFQHQGIFAAEVKSRLPLRVAYIGLWTQADKRGLFRWRPDELKLNILPWDDVDFGKVLSALAKYGFIVRYEVAGEAYGAIPSFAKHQWPNSKEKASALIPNPPDTMPTPCQHGANPVGIGIGLGIGLGVGKGKDRVGEGNGEGNADAAARLGGLVPPSPPREAEESPSVRLLRARSKAANG